jgi:regulator of replication initiation timing
MEIIEDLRKDIQSLSKQLENIERQLKEDKTTSKISPVIQLDSKKVAENLTNHLINTTEKETTQREEFLKTFQSKLQSIPQSIEYGLDASTTALIYSVVGSIIISIGVMYFFMRSHNTQQIKDQAEEIKYLQYEVNYLREKAPKAAAQFDKQQSQ